MRFSNSKHVYIWYVFETRKAWDGWCRKNKKNKYLFKVKILLKKRFNGKYLWTLLCTFIHYKVWYLLLKKLSWRTKVPPPILEYLYVIYLKTLFTCWVGPDVLAGVDVRHSDHHPVTPNLEKYHRSSELLGVPWKEPFYIEIFVAHFQLTYKNRRRRVTEN